MTIAKQIVLALLVSIGLVLASGAVGVFIAMIGIGLFGQYANIAIPATGFILIFLGILWALLNIGEKK